MAAAETVPVARLVTLVSEVAAISPVDSKPPVLAAGFPALTPVQAPTLALRQV